jgi:hypothetical protein
LLTIKQGVHAEMLDIVIQSANNTTNGNGGGIYNAGDLSVSASTFDGNQADYTTDDMETAITTVSGSGGGIYNTGDLSVSGSTFSANNAANGVTNLGNDSDYAGAGGAIYNSGTLTVSGSTFSRNVSNIAGAIASYGALSVSGSTFTANIAQGEGGAIDTADVGVGTAYVSTSTFSANMAESGGNGGAIANADSGGSGTLTVMGSTFLTDRAPDGGDGGAIYNGAGGTLSETTSTFSADTSTQGDGGAIYTAGDGTVASSTFSADNAEYDGGAIDETGLGTLRLSESTLSSDAATYAPGAVAAGPLSHLVISSSTFVGPNAVYATVEANVWVAANIFAGACERRGANWSDEGFDVGRGDSCLTSTADDVGPRAVLLSSLAANGGPTSTVEPLVANPAIGAVPDRAAVDLDGVTLTLCPATDQRGVHSSTGQPCAAGAVQLPGAVRRGRPVHWEPTAPRPGTGHRTWYAYAGATTSGLKSCPESPSKSAECTLSEALGLATAGGVVALATPGRARHYVGNWHVATPGTAISGPLVVQPAPGVAAPVLDGDSGKKAGCQTAQCNGAVLTLGTGLNVDIAGAVFASAAGSAIENGDHATLEVSACTFTGNLAPDMGAAIQNDNSGTVYVSGSRFVRNSAPRSGAIDNGAVATVIVAGSTFLRNTATDEGQTSPGGGAIANAGTLAVRGSTFTDNSAPGLNNFDVAGGAVNNNFSGELIVTGSTFSGNSSSQGAGGAVDNNNAANASVTGSTFVGNSAGWGGAVGNGSGTVTISRSTFSNNSSGNGGAIFNSLTDLYVYLPAVTRVLASTFVDNSGGAGGGAIANAFDGPSGTVVVSGSTFTGNTADGGSGGAIASGDASNSGAGTLTVWESTFSAKGANGAPGDNIADSGAGLPGDSVSVAANIFAGDCTQQRWHDEGYNVGRDRTCFDHGPGDVDRGAGLTDLLGPLANNGGPTRTIRPLVGNPAIGLIPYGTKVELGGESVTLCPTTDQRGVKSPPGHACDGGAVQVTGP